MECKSHHELIRPSDQSGIYLIEVECKSEQYKEFTGEDYGIYLIEVECKYSKQKMLELSWHVFI